MKIGLIREGKFPPDNRVALVPAQCRWIKRHYAGISIAVQSSPHRCFSDEEYAAAGVDVSETMDDCDLLMGIKEVPPDQLIEGKTFLFFSHTRKKQPHNQRLMQAVINKQVTLIDYECLEHEDGQRIIGFGFFAGLVGAHNGMMAFGKRTGAYSLERVRLQKSLRTLVHTYFGLLLPNIKVAVTGSGRVASGVLEIMNLLDIIEVEPEEYLEKDFQYPVYVHLKGADLYAHKQTGRYNRDHFHQHPIEYTSTFELYSRHSDILINGIYWQPEIPRLFEWEDLDSASFRIQTIADITDDHNGSVPCNIGDATADEPVYGVDKNTRQRTLPYVKNSIDIMAVNNLPNELPRDASRYFGQQLIKFVLPQLLKSSSDTIERATIVKQGRLTNAFNYLKAYSEGME